MKIRFQFAVAALVFTLTAQAQRRSADELTQLARNHDASLKSAIEASFAPKALRDGTAWLSHEHAFFFALQSQSAPQLVIDEQPPVAMQRVADSDLWFAAPSMERLDALHGFYYVVNGEHFGGSHDVPAFGPMHYADAKTPQGTLSPKYEIVSKIYDGMRSDYWIYVPAQYRVDKPAALMVFTDGQSHIKRVANQPAELNVIDHLIAAGKMPIAICVFTSPGDISGSPDTPTYRFVEAYAKKWNRTLKDSMRSTEYDTVSDRFARFLRDELLPEVEKKYNIRHDAYSRAIQGSSSGAIAAFNAAWQMPDQFSRVLSWIGTYTSIQWREDPTNPDGGHDYPEKVLRGPKRNIRVWLQDGSNDQENPRYGSWPLANLRMANALKAQGYDFHLLFGDGTHNAAQGRATLSQSLTWLWRDYDLAKTAQTFEQEETERAQPPFRVRVVNRSSE
ncbi:MAG: esterase [Acidobacteria bacterium]|nr:esterase [Acidobacteriota bacterium]